MAKKVVQIITQTKQAINRLWNHYVDFPLAWTLLLLLLVDMLLVPFEVAEVLAYCIMGLFIFILIFRPMNIIYGLLGTTGSLRSFFILMILSTFLFSGIYWPLFKDAGITYDVNQPHIEFSMFEDQDAIDTVVLFGGSQCQPADIQLHPDVDSTAHYYQRIDYGTVLRNTLLTTLMQEPSDFFAVSGTYNRYGDDESMAGNNDSFHINIEKARIFHWLSIFQIFISWLFLGVFISIVYKKFRNE